MQNIDAYEREVLSRAAFGKITREYSLVEEAIRIITVSEKRAPNNLPIAVGEYCRTRCGTSGGEIERTVERIDNEDHSTFYDTEYDIKAAEEHITEAAEGGNIYAAIFVLFYKRVVKWKLAFLSSWDVSTLSEYYFENSALLQKCFSVLKKCDTNDKFFAYALARAYDEGRGTLANTDTAISYYSRAAELGEDMAAVRLARYDIDADAASVRLAVAYGVLTRVKSCRPEHSTVAYYLGICHYFGLGTAQDYNAAFKEFSVGCASGGDSDVHTHDEIYCRKRYMKGVCHFLGLGTFKNITAARAEFLSAIVPLGMPEIKYAYGRALILYNPAAWRSIFGAIKSAADEDYLPAIRKLAEFYRTGFGTELNPEMSDALISRYNELKALGYATASDLDNTQGE